MAPITFAGAVRTAASTAMRGRGRASPSGSARARPMVQAGAQPQPFAIGRGNQERRGRVFPTSHDITPSFLPEALVTIENLLAKNKVLVVTKAHLSVVRKLCERSADRKTDLVLRFTIGSLDPDLCAFWEPSAPAPAERVEALHTRSPTGL